jgi:hypothetical protein
LDARHRPEWARHYGAGHCQHRVENGFIDTQLFAILVLMGALTTVVTPIALSSAFRRLSHSESQATAPPAVAVPQQTGSSAIHDPPGTHPDFKTVRRNTLRTFPAAELTDNDYDLDGGALTVISVTANGETHGQVG